VASTQAFRELTGHRVRIKAVDIGANPIDGTPPYANLLRAGDAEVVGFEPNPEALAVLQSKKGPFETYLPHAIGDGGRHTLKVCRAPGMTSLLTPNTDVLKLFHGFPEWGAVTMTIPVDTRRLDDIPETTGIDLIKIDIQGAELMALQNAQDRLKDALVVQTEVEFVPLYVNQPLFSDVDQFLRSRGFAFHRFYPAISRVMRPFLLNNDIYAGLSQLVWADAIFVKDFVHVERISNVQLLKTAAILHDCYQSFDLVLFLLTEYDSRTGDAVAPRYLSGLNSPDAVPGTLM
jgi:FkbM family methyltransferase